MPPALLSELENTVTAIAQHAQSAQVPIVFAESCTAGLAAQLLSRVPGASNWFCGSFVVYQNASKTAWLEIPAAQLDDPRVGPVSPETAAAMSAGALRHTPQARLSASVTGHLGPNAPPELDGRIYVSVQRRLPQAAAFSSAVVVEFRLPERLPEDSPFETLRLHRQHLAAAHLLQQVRDALSA